MVSDILLIIHPASTQIQKLSTVKLLLYKDFFLQPNFYLSKVIFICSVSTQIRILSSIQLPFSKNYFYQSNSYSSNVLFSKESYHQSSFRITKDFFHQSSVYLCNVLFIHPASIYYFFNSFHFTKTSFINPASI